MKLAEQTVQVIAAGIATRSPALAAQPEKVDAKVASLKRGLGYFVLGGLLLVAAMAVFLTVLLLFREQEIGLLFVVLALALPGLLGVAGVYLIFAGGNVASAEAMRAAAEDLKGIGGLAAKLITRAHKTG